MNYIRVLSSIFILYLPCLNAAEDIEARVFALSLEELMKLKVVTSTLKDTSQQESPGTTVIISRAQIQKRGYRHLLDLLRDATSFDIQYYADPIFISRISVRGVSQNNRVKILLNGVPLGSPTGLNFSIAENFPLYHLSKVEILYGPNSALYGADAVNGVINLVTESKFDNDYTLIAGEVGQSSYAKTYIYGQHKFMENWRVAYGTHIHDSDNPSLDKYYTEFSQLSDLTTFEQDIIQPSSSRQGYLADTSSDSTYLYFDYKNNFRIGYQSGTFDMPTTVGVKESGADYGVKARWDLNFWTAYSEYTHQVNSKNSLKFRLHLNEHEVSPNSKFQNLFSNHQPGFKYDFGQAKGFDGKWFTHSGKHHWTTGINYETLRSIPKTPEMTHRFNTSLPITEQHTYYLGTNEQLPIKFFNLEFSNTSVFVQHEYSWESRLKTFTGIRYDRNSRYGNNTSPRMGVIYQHNDERTFKVTYGEAFFAPAPTSAYDHFGSFTGTQNAEGDYISNFMRVPNENLKPETSKSIEFALENRIADNHHWRAVIYYQSFKNLTTTAPTPQPISDFISGGFINYTDTKINLDESNTYGFEYSGNWQYQLDWTNLSLWLNYSYVDGDRKRPGLEKTELAFVANNKLKLGATFELPSNWAISPSLYLLDETSTSSSEIKSVPGYLLANLFIEKSDLAPGLDLTIRINNLFNKKYYNAAGSSIISQTRSPQDPRQTFLGLSYKF